MSVGEFILVKDGVDITKSINFDNLQPATMTGSIIIKLSQGNRVSDVLSTVFLSSHSKPGTMALTRLLKYFVLQHSVIKTKHLRSLNLNY